MTLERIALTAMTALLAWVTFTVQSLAVDIAVLKNVAVTAVSQSEFIRVTSKQEAQLVSHTTWLTRLSERLNALETREQ